MLLLVKDVLHHMSLALLELGSMQVRVEMAKEKERERERETTWLTDR